MEPRCRDARALTIDHRSHLQTLNPSQKGTCCLPAFQKPHLDDDYDDDDRRHLRITDSQKSKIKREEVK